MYMYFVPKLICSGKNYKLTGCLPKIGKKSKQQQQQHQKQNKTNKNVSGVIAQVHFPNSHSG